jgi:hypothetical protein
MFFRCIQKYDPFNAKAKAEMWDTIANAMIEATKHLKHEADGDFSVYGNGRSMQMFYNRRRDLLKKETAGDGHSGVAGKEMNPARQEENNQLSACMELERCAKAQQEKKREATAIYDKVAKGEVNDFVIESAVGDDKVRSKLVKVLSSRLREAKIRKLAFEQANKGATYTYTPTDLANFESWGKLKDTCPDIQDIDSSDQSSGRASSLAAAIQEMAAKLPSTLSIMPVSPQDYAQAFFAAKRASVPTLKEKLAAVDADFEEGLLTEEEVIFYKTKIKQAHYLSIKDV